MFVLVFKDITDQKAGKNANQLNNVPKQTKFKLMVDVNVNKDMLETRKVSVWELFVLMSIKFLSAHHANANNIMLEINMENVSLDAVITKMSSMADVYVNQDVDITHKRNVILSVKRTKFGHNMDVFVKMQMKWKSMDSVYLAQLTLNPKLINQDVTALEDTHGILDITNATQIFSAQLTLT